MVCTYIQTIIYILAQKLHIHGDLFCILKVLGNCFNALKEGYGEIGA